MAKSDSFFIRAQVVTNGTNYVQESIDLGAYVDALGKSVLRIHNIAVQYGSPLNVPAVTANEKTVAAFQITTQSQSSLVSSNDKSVISTGSLCMSGDAGTSILTLSEALDVAPQMWTKGYLVGVEQIYLAADQTADRINQVNVVMECSVETLSQSAAMALALSQQ